VLSAACSTLLIDHVDHEGAARLRAWIGTIGTRLGTSDAGARFLEEGFARVLARSEPRLAKARGLTPAERASLSASGLLKPPAPTRSTVTLEALLEAVYAAPEDDAPRAVLADLLQEKGDPRGELIALDLLPAPTEEQRVRRRRLINEHGKRWFPPALDKVIKRDSAEYERGFLARGTLMRSDRTPIELATFRELTFTTSPPDLAHPVFRGVQAWRGFELRRDAGLLRDLAPQPRVRRLGVRASFDLAPAALCELLRPATWPRVEELGLELVVDRARYNLDHWDLPSVPGWIDDVVAGLANQLPALQRVAFEDFGIFDRLGRATEIELPWQLTGQFLNTYLTGQGIAARQRWFAWLVRKAVPVLVEHHGLLAQFSAELAPLEVRVRTRSTRRA
jgi:uncharacterized protein (TIGR02996 family)